VNKFHFDYDLYNLVKSNFLFEPSGAINFIINLPFMLPIKDKQIYTVNFTNASQVIIFDTFIDSINEPTFPDVKKEISLGNFSYNRSRIECVFFHNFEIKIDDDKKIYDLLNEALDILNIFINSLLMVLHDGNITNITPTSFFNGIFYQIISLPNFDILDSSFFLTNANYKTIMLPIDDDSFKIVRNIADKLYYEENAFKSVRILYNKAKYYVLNCNYSEAIIFMQMTIESFIRSIYKLSLKQEGKLEDEITDILEEISFMHLIKNKMPKLLEGNWSLNDNKIVSLWYNNVYKSRNKIIHGDFNPLEEECINLFLITNNFIDFLQKRINKIKKRAFYIYDEYYKLPPIFFIFSELDIDKIVKKFEQEKYNLFKGDNIFRL